MRALIYVRLPEGKVDERGFAALKQISSELPAAKRLGLARFKEIVKEQYLILLLDEERAIAALPKLLPDDRRQCEEALALVRRVLAARGALPEEGRRRLEAHRGDVRRCAARDRPRQGGVNRQHMRRAWKQSRTGRTTLRPARATPRSSLPPVTTAVAHPCDGSRSRASSKRPSWG